MHLEKIHFEYRALKKAWLFCSLNEALPCSNSVQLNLKMLGVITEISFRQAPHLPSQAMSTRPILILTSLFQALSTKEKCRVKLEDGYSFHKVQCALNFFTFYTEFRMFCSSNKQEFLKVFHFFFPFLYHMYTMVTDILFFPAILF